jgi:excisionase family DNA binding protein
MPCLGGYENPFPKRKVCAEQEWSYIMSLAGVSAAPEQDRSAGIDLALLPADDRLLRASEVQRELGISRATAYRMMTDGTLPVYRFGGRKGRRAMVRVSYKELRTWIAAHKAESPAAA